MNLIRVLIIDEDNFFLEESALELSKFYKQFEFTLAKTDDNFLNIAQKNNIDIAIINSDSITGNIDNLITKSETLNLGIKFILTINKFQPYSHYVESNVSLFIEKPPNYASLYFNILKLVNSKQIDNKITTHNEETLKDIRLGYTNQLVQGFISITPEPLLIINRKGKIIFISEQAKKIINIDSNDKYFYELIPKNKMKKFNNILKVLLLNKKIKSIDFSLINKRSNEISVKISASVIYEKSNKANSFIVFIEDISRKLKDEYEKTLLVKAVEQSAESIIITDANEKIIYTNPAFQTITGYSKEEVIGKKPIFLRSGSHDKTFYKNLKLTIYNGQTWKGHFINQKKDGQFYEEDATISPVKNQDGGISNFVAVKRDVTEKIEMQKKLLQAQKMEALGTLASGIAHDFNNILSAIFGYSEIIVEEFDDSFLIDCVNKIEIAAERARDLVKQILTFTSQTEHNDQPLYLSIIIKEALKLLRATIPTNIKIISNIDNKIPPVLCDPIKIHQIIMNLCTNASHAMQNTNGQLTITLTNTTIDSTYNLSEPTPGNYNHLIIEDTGSGIPEEIIEKIYDPYFTTKEPGKGTGLGLSVVHGIVKSYGGVIKVTSKIESGTKFEIFLPSSTPDASSEDIKITETVKGNGEQIVVIDDEKDILFVLDSILSSLNYQVQCFNKSTDGFNYILNNHEKISLIITDQAMPKMTGIQLSTSLRKKKIEIPILLYTGFAQQSRIEEAYEVGINEVIFKPVDKFTLSVTIQKLIEKN